MTSSEFRRQPHLPLHTHPAGSLSTLLRTCRRKKMAHLCKWCLATSPVQCCHSHHSHTTYPTYSTGPTSECTLRAANHSCPSTRTTPSRCTTSSSRTKKSQ